MAIQTMTKWAACFLLVLWPLLHLNLYISDDVFVYFNYAKNFANGNYFAYDSRHIPSEGFTSLLYLLLLVPFQWLKVSMPFAAFMINLTSLYLAAFATSRIYKRLVPSEEKNAWVAGGVFLLLAYLDKNITGISGWGFETILNLNLFLVLIACFIEVQRQKTVFTFARVLVVFGLSVLVRPENIAICSPWVFASFLSVRRARGTKYALLLFTLSIFIFVSWKRQIFNDLFPTGFYRKVKLGSLEFAYLKAYLNEYWVYTLLFVIGMVGTCLKIRSAEISGALKLGFISLATSVFALLVFSTKLNPLVGVFYRYVILITGSYLLFLSLAISYFGFHRGTLRSGLITLFAFLLFVGGVQRQRNSPFSLPRESEALLDQHPYVRFAKYMQKKNPNPEQMTVMFGDAGAIPYFFDCKFVDVNGLTEPYLAKMFREKERKVEKVSEYIKQNAVDLAVLAVEGVGLDLRRDSQHLPHGPLNRPQEYREFLERQRQEGFVYVGSIYGIDYTLHFGARKSSNQFEKIRKDIEDYTKTGNGYLLSSDLKVRFSNGDVIFKNASSLEMNPFGNQG